MIDCLILSRAYYAINNRFSAKISNTNVDQIYYNIRNSHNSGLLRSNIHDSESASENYGHSASKHLKSKELLFILTANGFLPGGSGTTIRHNTQGTHITKLTHHAQTKHSAQTKQAIRDTLHT
jgi:hypothetical protein